VVLPHDEAGAGPAVVLLHAGVADRTMWAEHLPPLAAAGFRAVAMDLPGFGAAPPADRTDPWTDVLETMDSLGISTAAIAGNSFGGAVAYNLAVAAPERVTSLALISAPAPDLDPSAELQRIWEAEESALERGDLDGAVEAVVRAWTLPDASEELRARVGAMQRRAFEHAGAAPPTEVPAPAEQDPGLLGRLETPALVACGQLDLPDFQLSAESLAARLRASPATVIPQAGHLAPLEQPEEFDRLLIAFLEG